MRKTRSNRLGRRSIWRLPAGALGPAPIDRDRPRSAHYEAASSKVANELRVENGVTAAPVHTARHVRTGLDDSGRRQSRARMSPTYCTHLQTMWLSGRRAHPASKPRVARGLCPWYRPRHCASAFVGSRALSAAAFAPLIGTVPGLRRGRQSPRMKSCQFSNSTGSPSTWISRESASLSYSTATRTA